MNLWSGTSGYSYKEWKGSFYPADLPAAKMLDYYAKHLTAVEIDNTFYRLPRASVLAGWAEQVPERFRFTLKASRRITHFKRLKETDDETGYLIRTAASLGEKLGAILFQLPPNLSKDIGRLERFLTLLDGGTRAAIEFRHVSWFDEEVFDLLRSHGLPLCVVDSDEELAVPFVSTAPWGYIRLRRAAYTEADLDAWLARIASQGWSEAYVFFKHEDGGVGAGLAAQLMRRAVSDHASSGTPA